jgi:hypothetical protein
MSRPDRDMHQTSIWLPRELEAVLKREAKELGIGFSEVIRARLQASLLYALKVSVRCELIEEARSTTERL